MAVRHDFHDAYTPVADRAARPKPVRRGRDCFSALIRRAGAPVARLCAALAPDAAHAPVIACADPEEAYLQACIASPLFCYVSPALYGLGPAADKRGDAPPVRQPGEGA